MNKQTMKIDNSKEVETFLKNRQIEIANENRKNDKSNKPIIINLIKEIDRIQELKRNYK